MIPSIILFFVIMLGLGFPLGQLLKLKFNDQLETLFMSLAIGMGTFPILSTVLGILRAPLDWKIFLGVSLTLTVAWLFRKKFSLKFEKKTVMKESSRYIGVVLVMAIVLFGVYWHGANKYPYLEDDDPWEHALAAKFISVEKSISQPENFSFHYIDPYPPAFDILLGILHQTNDSIYTTLKFFNVLIISLGIIFFYYFAEKLFKDKTKAIYASFILTVLPCFMSHFIWAQSLALVLFFPAWYCYENIREDKKWMIPAVIITASIIVTQPSAAAIFVVMTGIYWIGEGIVQGWKKSLFFLYSLILGCITSGIYWIVMISKYGLMGMLREIGFAKGLLSAENVDTSSGLIYSINDFIIAPLHSKIDQPTGIGAVVFILLVLTIGILFLQYKKTYNKQYIIVSFLWLILTIVGTEGNALPYKLFPHRFWAFLAIPVALLVGIGMYKITRALKGKNIRFAVISIIIAGIMWTSAYPKYVFETSIWSPGIRWSSSEEIAAFVWLKILPADTKVFLYTNKDDSHIIGFDKFSCSWCREIVEFRQNLMNKTIDELLSFLQMHNYEYMVIGRMSFKELSLEYGEYDAKIKISSLISSMQNSGNFKIAHRTQGGALIVKVI
jgi:hypothetical protein